MRLLGVLACAFAAGFCLPFFDMMGGLHFGMINVFAGFVFVFYAMVLIEIYHQ